MSPHNAGVIVGALLLPLTGLTLLIVGLVLRFRPRQAPPVPPQWNPPPATGSAPAGRWAVLPATGSVAVAAPTEKRGTGLIIAGAVLLVL